MLFIGFGRFGQVVSQSLLARGIDVSIIDTDVEMIRAPARSASRSTTATARGSTCCAPRAPASAEAILVCVDKPEAADRIVELVKSEFPLAKVLVRSFDRGHSLALDRGGRRLPDPRDVRVGADLRRRSRCASSACPRTRRQETVEDIRRRDAERFALETTGGLLAGRDLLHSNVPTPVPFTTPRRRRAAEQPAADGVEKGG